MTKRERFYNSSAWKHCRTAYIKHRQSIDGGLCESCHEAIGYIVHHKTWLNDSNIDNPEVALNLDNLKYDCLICHNKEKDMTKAKTNERYRLNDNGDILPP